MSKRKLIPTCERIEIIRKKIASANRQLLELKLKQYKRVKVGDACRKHAAQCLSEALINIEKLFYMYPR